MRTWILICIGVALVGVTNTLFADDEKKVERKIPAHSKEWTDHNSSDPGVRSTMDELATIVVLCATDHQSTKFKRAWSVYLRRHKPNTAETGKIIDQVLARAQEHREELGQEKKDRKRASNWRGEADKVMQDVSKAVMRRARD